MKDIEMLEINEIGDYEESLSLLLEDSINSGASIGLLATLSYWSEVNHKLVQDYY